MMNSNNVDIFSDAFFAEDPFGDQEINSNEDLMTLSLELYTVEENICHSQDHSFETLSVASEHDHDPVEPAETEVQETTRSDNTNECSEQEELNPKPMYDDCQENKVEEIEHILPDDSETNTTCRSTEFESSDLNYNAVQSPHSSMQDANAEETDWKDSVCQSCVMQKQTIRKQEEEIFFLRRKLQEYSDLCKRYNIGQHILTSSDEALASNGSKTARTTYEDRTYADLIGPWDIPFHVELIRREFSYSSDEFSGITFAQHPSKTRDTVQRIRPCPTDDDDALPLVRRFHRKPSRSWGMVPRQQTLQCYFDRSMEQMKTGLSPGEIYPGRIPNKKFTLEDPCINQTDSCDFVFDRRCSLQTERGTIDGQRDHCELTEETSIKHKELFDLILEKRLSMRTRRNEMDEPRDHSEPTEVKCMSVVIERKYGRQKALYSGTVIHGCPHGVGTLQFIQSGDAYIGEVAFGEMHGKGTYCHRKSNKIFRGTFVRNSFAGTGDV